MESIPEKEPAVIRTRKPPSLPWCASSDPKKRTTRAWDVDIRVSTPARRPPDTVDRPGMAVQPETVDAAAHVEEHVVPLNYCPFVAWHGGLITGRNPVVKRSP